MSRKIHNLAVRTSPWLAAALAFALSSCGDSIASNPDGRGSDRVAGKSGQSGKTGKSTKTDKAEDSGNGGAKGGSKIDVTGDDLPDVDVTGAGTAPQPSPPSPSPAVVHELVPIHRSFRGDHLYGIDPNEGVPYGYQPEGSFFHLLRTNIQDSVPLYRCLTAALVHFLSLDGACEGHSSEGVLGHLMPSQLPGTIPLSRCHNATATDFIIVPDTTECVNAGYTIQGQIGFAPTPGFQTGGS